MAFKKEEIIIIEPSEIFVGKKDAPVTLVEFGEYENEECAKVNEVVKQLLVKYDGKIRFQFRHYPLTLIHQRSLKASESAVAAAQEGKFWEMHNILFANRRNLGTTSLKLHSKEAGVNNKKFLDELVNGMYGWQVQDDIKEGRNRGLKNDIPAFFVNGERVKLKPTLANLSNAIEAALKNKKSKSTATAKPKAKAKPAVKEKAKPAAKAKTPAKTAKKAAKKAPVKKKAKSTAKKTATSGRKAAAKRK
ncbi:MAG TPA: thioredoxin domain-containing protein [Chitinophagaceae bacterium]|nr:thioredoxin domain-containing protein [Chitinophagaceae bacterium]